MAGTISFDGLATGINATETVDKLMEVESRPKILKQAELTRQQNEQAAWREVNTKLLALKDQSQKLWRSSTWSTLKISSSNSSVLTASATATAKEGIYTLSVEQLALNGQKVSKNYAATTSLVGAGTLDMSIGTDTESITVTATDTLATLAGKINDSTLAVTASVVKDGTQYKLLISADKTGVDNDVTLGGDVATALTLTSVQAAQDAKVKFGTDDVAKGATAMTFTSATNKVDGVIDGVTLNLQSASPGEAITLATSREASSVKDEVQKFVDSFNEIITFVNKLTDYNAESKTRGVLQADGSVRGIAERLKYFISASVSTSSAFKTLRSAGIAFKDDGTLSLDEEKLGTALAGDYSGVEALFRDSTNGLMPKVDKYLADVTSPIIGLTDRKLTSLDETVRKTQSRIEDMDARLKTKRETLMAKFVAMESAVNSMKTQSGYLTNQLAGINSNWG